MKALQILLAALAAGRCRRAAAPPVPGSTDDEKLALYRAHARPAGRELPLLRQPHGWTPLGDSAVAIWTRPSEAYLLEVHGPCPDLDFAQAIGLTNQFGRVYTRFDKVIPRVVAAVRSRFLARSSEIRPLDVKALKAAEQDARDTAQEGCRDLTEALRFQAERNPRVSPRRRRRGTSPSRLRGRRGACGSSGERRFSLISMVWCASHVAHAGLPMWANTRLPSSPGQGTKSRPSVSRCSYSQ